MTSRVFENGTILTENIFVKVKRSSHLGGTVLSMLNAVLTAPWVTPASPPPSLENYIQPELRVVRDNDELSHQNIKCLPFIFHFLGFINQSPQRMNSRDCTPVGGVPSCAWGPQHDGKCLRLGGQETGPGGLPNLHRAAPWTTASSRVAWTRRTGLASLQSWEEGGTKSREAPLPPP